MARHPRGRLRRRGQAPHHPRHLRPERRLLRRLLRLGPEGAHADPARLRRRLRAGRRARSPRRRRPRRSSSARSSTTRWRCTSTTSPPSPPTWPASPGCRCPAAWPTRTACRSGIQILAPARQDARLYRVGAALEALLEAQWGGPLLERPRRSLTTSARCRRHEPRRFTLMTDATLSYDEAMAKYDPVMGFEVHVELGTKTKMFSVRAERASATSRTRNVNDGGPRPARRRCRWSTRPRSSPRSRSASR